MKKKSAKKRRITIRSAKNKGKKFQNWIASQFSELSGIPWGLDLDIESRQMGMRGTDIIFRGKAKEMFKYSIEAKNCEQFSLPAWVKQAKDNKQEDTDWLLFITKNHFDKMVVMDASTFFNLLKQLKEK